MIKKNIIWLYDTFLIFFRTLFNGFVYYLPVNSSKRQLDYFTKKQKEYNLLSQDEMESQLTYQKSVVDKQKMLFTFIVAVLFSALISGLGNKLLLWVQQEIALSVYQQYGNDTLKEVPLEIQLLAEHTSQTITIFILLLLIVFLLIFIQNITTNKRILYILETVYEKNKIR